METAVIVQMISVIGAVATAGIAAWATIIAARINAAKSKPEPPQPPAVGPASPPLPPPSDEEPPVSAGRRNGLWVAAGIFVIAAIFSDNRRVPTPPMGRGCYDQWGNRRCQLPYPMPIGQPCGCFGEGMGVVGP